MNKKIFCLRVLFTALLLCTYIVIFIYSSENGEKSSNKSKGTMYNIICIVHGKENVTNQEVESLEPILRKLAHFGIYTMSGIWSMCLMCTFFGKEENHVEENSSENVKIKNIITKIKMESKTKEFRRVVISALTGFIYACSDEIHQLFSPGRSGKIIDIVIDTMGVLNGVLLVLLICKLYVTIKKHCNE